MNNDTASRAVVDPEMRKQLRDQLMLLMAGQRFVDTWAAMSDYFSAIVAFAARDRDHAREIADLLAADMKSNFDLHWDFYRAQRAAHVDRPAGVA